MFSQITALFLSVISAIFSLPVMQTLMLSVTLKSASFLIVCSFEIISLTKPSSSSSGVMWVSRATITLLPDTDSKPSVCLTSMSKSSAPSLTSPVDSVRVTAPFSSSSFLAFAPSRADRAFLTSPSCLPKRGPSVLSCGLNRYEM